MYGQYLAQVQVEAIRRSGLQMSSRRFYFSNWTLETLGKARHMNEIWEKKEKKQPNVSQSLTVERRKKEQFQFPEWSYPEFWAIVLHLNVIFFVS